MGKEQAKWNRENVKAASWEDLFSAAGAGLVIVPCILLFILVKLMKIVTSEVTPPPREPSDKAPEDPFLVQIATVLEYIRVREKYKFSNKQLYLDYRNHVQSRARLIFLKEEDVRFIGKVCMRFPRDATALLANPALLDSINGRFRQLNR